MRAGGSRPVTVLLAVALALGGGVLRGQPAPPSRIVSAVPSVTEILFAIGAGPQVVAVSSFDSYPPQVTALPRIGGLLDPNVERILSLKPDLVVVYDTQIDLRAQLARAGITTFSFRHEGLGDVLATIRDVGRLTGRAADADRTAVGIEARLDAVRRRVAGRPRPRTLVVMGRDPFALRNIYASGGLGFVHDMLDAAGGVNVFADVARESVQATSELVLARAPEVILELKGEFGSVKPEEDERDRRTWWALPSVPAVRAGRVYVRRSASFVVPGPRVADAVEALARTLHPQAF
jgi:iron complex transport system substrate-binding protein